MALSSSFWIMPPEIRGSGGIFSEILEVCFSLAEPRGDILEKIGSVVLGAFVCVGAAVVCCLLGCQNTPMCVC